MTALATIVETPLSLAGLVDRAVAALANARSAAEVLEARDLAGAVYDVAKRVARLGRAKQAHDDLIAAAYRAQADALEIEAQAKRRLADEYDAAQERGEASAQGQHGAHVPNENMRATTSDLGLSRKAIHEARLVRDAEKAEPGIVRRAVDEAVAAGEEPSKAKVNRAIKKAAKRTPKRRVVEIVETQHDRDLKMLLGVWGAACETARTEFLKTVSG
jgi:hypothetical protein